MDFNTRSDEQRGDEGVSPVIAVILMVAITVVLAATVYVWVSGFATDDTGPEQASATAKGLDTDNDGDVDMMRVTLTSGENSPYTLRCRVGAGSDCSGNGAYLSDTELLVSGTDGAGNAIDASSLYTSSGASTVWSDNSTWSVGEAIYVDCGAAGTADLSVSVGRGSNDNTAVLDTTIECDEA